MSFLDTLGLVSFLIVLVFTWQAAASTERTGIGQSAREAIIEAWTNVVIGFSVNWTANFLLLPLVHAHFTAWQNFELGWVYTAVSVIRQFVIRRWFNSQAFARKLSSILNRAR